MTRKSLIRDQSETTTIDLEEAIMHCWQIVDDLDLALELLDHNDEAAKLILVIKAIYEIKFPKLWKAFEQIKNTRGIIT